MISVRIKGKILNMGELKSGVSQRGKAWKNIQFTIMANPADAQTDQAVCSARDEVAQMLHDNVKLDPYGISIDNFEAVGYLKVDTFPNKSGSLISRNNVECWSVIKAE